MGLFSRAHDIVSAKANKALDKAERPDEMLDLSYERMLEQITQVRRALVDIAAARKRIELQAQQLQQSAEHLTDQARTAVGAGREDLAREALARKAAAVGQIQEIEPQHQQLMDEEDKLTRTLQALQARVNQFRTQKETLKAQYTAARASTAVNENLAGITKSIGDSGAALQRAQDKIAGLQARSGALDELLESGALEELGTGGDDIDRELRQLGSASSVDQELAALKAGVQAPGALTPPSAEALPAGGQPSGEQASDAEAEEGMEPGRPA
jgi:phage shock protein A